MGHTDYLETDPYLHSLLIFNQATMLTWRQRQIKQLMLKMLINHEEK